MMASLRAYQVPYPAEFKNFIVAELRRLRDIAAAAESAGRHDAYEAQARRRERGALGTAVDYVLKMDADDSRLYVLFRVALVLGWGGISGWRLPEGSQQRRVISVYALSEPGLEVPGDQFVSELTAAAVDDLAEANAAASAKAGSVDALRAEFEQRLLDAGGRAEAAEADAEEQRGYLAAASAERDEAREQVSVLRDAMPSAEQTRKPNRRRREEAAA